MSIQRRNNLILKQFLLLLGMLFSFFGAIAQQEPMYTQNNFDRLMFNPAYAGSSNWIVSSIKHRSQFVGLEGGPVTDIITIHAPWQARSVGFGGKVVSDRLGATTQTTVNAIGSYHIGLGKGKMSVGLEFGIFNQAIDFSTLFKNDKIDNAIPPGKTAKTKLDGAFGLQYQTKNYFVGLSVQHLFGGSLNFTDYDRSIVANLHRHWFISGGYVKDLSKKLSVQPCILLKKVSGAPMQLDIYANFIYQEKYTLGVGYRTGDALTFAAKVNITDAIRVSYSYDFRISQVATYSNAAHEFMVRYGIKLLPPQQIKEINPRYYF
jgi:type IX secretion system PorP/SprF family membrane protein